MDVPLQAPDRPTQDAGRGPLSQAAFHVAELDCAEEVLALRRELEGTAGVTDLDFDVLRSRMTVEFDAEQISPTEIVSRVGRIGMHARLWEDRQDERSRQSRAADVRLWLTLLSGSLLLAGFVFHVTATGDLLAALGHAAAGPGFPVVSRVCYILSVSAGLWLVLPKAWTALRGLRADMNLLMSIAAFGAMLLGQWLEAATVTFLFALSLLLEHWSLGRARRAIAALLDLTPPTARCVCDHGDHEHIAEKHVEDVHVGETVIVRPGERIPLDGIVTTGSTTVDEAAITGESVPVTKQPADEVFAGTINGEGAIQFQVTKPAADTTLARILQMVEQAQSRRAPSERWVERFARYYTPTMILLAVAVMLVPPLLLSGAWREWAYNGLVLLVIACPCALVISTPVSIVSALTSATRHGVLIKGGRYLEEAARIEALALDKTGTLTRGEMVVQQVIPLAGHTEAELLARAAAMEAHSQHPLARAILAYSNSRGVAVETADEYRLLQGLGAEGVFNGKRFWIGSHRLMEQQGQETESVHQQAVELEDAGHTVVAIGNADHVCGLFGVADELRENAAESMQRLKRVGVQHLALLSGDNERTAQEVGRAAAIDEVRADLLPEDKVREIERLRQQFSSVAMVGDGVNDAPALATATLGIAMGTRGVDAAIETADVALMSDDLSRIPWLIEHGRKTLAIIRQNVVFALGLKAAFIVLTLSGAASLWAAIAADTGASLLVIFNGLRLLKA